MSRGLFNATKKVEIQNIVDSIKIEVTPFDTNQPAPSSYIDGGHTVTLSTAKKNVAAVDALRHFTHDTFQVALKYKMDYSYDREQDVCFKHFIIGLVENKDADTFSIRFHMPLFKPSVGTDFQQEIGNAWECLMRMSEIEPNRMTDIQTAFVSELAEKLMETVGRICSTRHLMR